MDARTRRGAPCGRPLDGGRPSVPAVWPDRPEGKRRANPARTCRRRNRLQDHLLVKARDVRRDVEALADQGRERLEGTGLAVAEEDLLERPALRARDEPVEHLAAAAGRRED